MEHFCAEDIDPTANESGNKGRWFFDIVLDLGCQFISHHAAIQ